MQIYLSIYASLVISIYLSHRVWSYQSIYLSTLIYSFVSLLKISLLKSLLLLLLLLLLVAQKHLISAVKTVLPRVHPDAILPAFDTKQLTQLMAPHNEPGNQQVELTPAWTANCQLILNIGQPVPGHMFTRSNKRIRHLVTVLPWWHAVPQRRIQIHIYI